MGKSNLDTSNFGTQIVVATIANYDRLLANGGVFWVR